MNQPVVDQAYDLNGAVAGDFEPNPELDTVDKIASKTGVEVSPENPLNIYETLKERDENRLETPN